MKKFYYFAYHQVDTGSVNPLIQSPGNPFTVSILSVFSYREGSGKIRAALQYLLSPLEQYQKWLVMHIAWPQLPLVNESAATLPAALSLISLEVVERVLPSQPPTLLW